MKLLDYIGMGFWWFVVLAGTFSGVLYLVFGLIVGGKL